jgi:hypothetical protein
MASSGPASASKTKTKRTIASTVVEYKTAQVDHAMVPKAVDCIKDKAVQLPSLLRDVSTYLWQPEPTLNVTDPTGENLAKQFETRMVLNPTVLTHIPPPDRKQFSITDPSGLATIEQTIRARFGAIHDTGITKSNNEYVIHFEGSNADVVCPILRARFMGVATDALSETSPSQPVSTIHSVSSTIHQVIETTTTQPLPQHPSFQDPVVQFCLMIARDFKNLSNELSQAIEAWCKLPNDKNRDTDMAEMQKLINLFDQNSEFKNSLIPALYAWKDLVTPGPTYDVTSDEVKSVQAFCEFARKNRATKGADADPMELQPILKRLMVRVPLGEETTRKWSETTMLPDSIVTLKAGRINDIIESFRMSMLAAIPTS